MRDLEANTIRKLKRRIYYLGKELQQQSVDHKLLFEEMNAAFALHEIITDDEGSPIDYRFIKVNKTFEKFQQVDPFVIRRHRGTGLGLSISKGSIELLEGEIWFEPGKEKGTTSYFSLTKT